MVATNFAYKRLLEARQDWVMAVQFVAYSVCDMCPVININSIRYANLVIRESITYVNIQREYKAMNEKEGLVVCTIVHR